MLLTLRAEKPSKSALLLICQPLTLNAFENAISKCSHNLAGEPNWTPSGGRSLKGMDGLNQKPHIHVRNRCLESRLLRL